MEIADWTPGMVFDMVFYKVNDREEAKAPKGPSQGDFDSF